MEIVFASKNEKKAEELQRMAGKEVKILCLKDIPETEKIPQAEETGTTFIENAKIKAEYWAEKLQMPALGEDSGIEIDALDGAPGVYTKRSMAILCPGEDINVDKPSELYPKFLELMKKSGNTSKKAHWVTAMVLAYPDKTNIEVVNQLDGEMCDCAGEHEFGFDQYFRPEGKEQTLSEMKPEEKDSIGPRRKSFEDILSKIHQKLLTNQ